MSNALMFPGGRPRMVRRSFLWSRMNGDEAAAFINKKTALAITPVVGRRSAGATTRKVGGMPARADYTSILMLELIKKYPPDSDRTDPSNMNSPYLPR